MYHHSLVLVLNYLFFFSQVCKKAYEFVAIVVRSTYIFLVFVIFLLDPSFFMPTSSCMATLVDVKLHTFLV